uniref:Uncharacterized protein n=1 Tax=Chromera velia CCMP2878 TaxID=1169474 RepID=A0A0G4I4U5_9ALVE|eukprot:Cvel_11021.t1-p1 / transcript=Cvel_11021.t1 / gene=Cvel_11021 / organism=Chromera_velia_CCMP2878 / gene_product=hypothetical protein / transcript_product=hypothetical protein / location=Cvel_scaffold679:63283-70528(+) / protein_length=746 / sequence_SO=supercontig / SO=protein_coding / is_pseudo=false
MDTSEAPFPSPSPSPSLLPLREDHPHCAQYSSGVDLRWGGDLQRVLTDDAPGAPYRRRKNEPKTVRHWGQRKLLMAEIEFLVRVFSDKDRILPLCLQQKVAPRQLCPSLPCQCQEILRSGQPNASLEGVDFNGTEIEKAEEGERGREIPKKDAQSLAGSTHQYSLEMKEELERDEQHTAHPRIELLYVGAAGGQHIPLLVDGFPSVHFSLFDPRPFCQSLCETTRQRGPRRVRLFQREFTDADAQQWGRWAGRRHDPCRQRGKRQETEREDQRLGAVRAKHAECMKRSAEKEKTFQGLEKERPSKKQRMDVQDVTLSSSSSSSPGIIEQKEGKERRGSTKDVELPPIPDMFLFVSDARTADWQEMSPEENEKAVEADNKAVKRWLDLLSPDAALLKFRLPYGEGVSEFPAGDVMLPVWGPPTTTETRLLVPSTSLSSCPLSQRKGKTQFDHSKYGNQMFYFNTETRVHVYPVAKEIRSAALAAQHPLDGCFDCASEVSILSRYVSLMACNRCGLPPLTSTHRKERTGGEGKRKGRERVHPLRPHDREEKPPKKAEGGRGQECKSVGDAGKGEGEEEREERIRQRADAPPEEETGRERDRERQEANSAFRAHALQAKRDSSATVPLLFSTDPLLSPHESEHPSQIETADGPTVVKENGESKSTQTAGVCRGKRATLSPACGGGSAESVSAFPDSSSSWRKSLEGKSERRITSPPLEGEASSISFGETVVLLSRHVSQVLSPEGNRTL